MTATKLLAILSAVLLVSAGAGSVVAADASATIESETEAESAPAGDVGVDATYDDGTVDLTVTLDGSGVAGVDVTADGDAVGETDGNGSLAFETNATETLNLTLSSTNFTAEYAYAIENGSLVLEDSDVEFAGDEEDEARKGPNENASETAHNVWNVIRDWINGDRAGNLGQLIQAALGHDDGNGERAANGTARGEERGHAGQAQDGETPPGHEKRKSGDRNRTVEMHDAVDRPDADEKPGHAKGHDENRGKQNAAEADETDGEADETETDEETDETETDA